MSTNRILLYKRYERFWHWAQALLVIFMLITGFEIHGAYGLFGFARAAARTCRVSTSERTWPH